MPPSPTRRSLLAATAAVSSSALAGCANVLGSKELAHEVEVYNYTDAAHDPSVRVTDDAGDVLYSRQFHLEGNHGEEDTDPFTGVPETIVVTVGEGEPAEYDWPNVDCEDRGSRSAGGADLYITAEDGIRLEPTCDTVYAE